MWKLQLSLDWQKTSGMYFFSIGSVSNYQRRYVRLAVETAVFGQLAQQQAVYEQNCRLIVSHRVGDPRTQLM